MVRARPWPRLSHAHPRRRMDRYTRAARVLVAGTRRHSADEADTRLHQNWLRPSRGKLRFGFVCDDSAGRLKVGASSRVWRSAAILRPTAACSRLIIDLI